MSKFVGKFRKNQNYNDDSNYDNKKRHRDEHSEIRKLKNRKYDSDTFEEYESIASLPKEIWN